MQFGRRITSVVLSAAMFAGNLMTPVTAYAGEIPADPAAQIQTEAGASAATDEAQAPPAGTSGNDVQAETSPQTEAPDFQIILQYEDAFGLGYDQTHFLSEDREKKTTTLVYKQGEEVNLDVIENPGFQIDKIFLQDADVPVAEYQETKGKEYPYTWKDEDTITFTMPDTDLWLKSEWHQKETEPLVPVTEVPQSAETLTSEIPATDAVGESQAHTDEAVPQDAGQADVTSQSGETMQEPAVQTEQASTASEQSETSAETQDTSSVIDNDGFPAQGSIIMLSEVSIGIDVTEIAEEHKFDDVAYPQDTCTSSLVDNEVKYGTPGLYHVVYRVDEANTGKSWYVVHPVRVTEVREAETQTDSSSEAESGTDQQTEDDGSDDDSDDADASPAAIVETEADAAQEETESMTEAESSLESDSGLTKVVSETELSDETESMDATETFDETEVFDETETESENVEGTFQVILKEGSEYNVTLDHEDGFYDAGQEVVVRSDLDAYQTDIAAWRTINHNNNDTGDYCEVTYHPDDNSFSFVMPAEDVELSVREGSNASAAPRRMMMAPRRAAAAADDNDGGWDDQTDVATGSYYYHTDGNYTGHTFNNDLGSGGADSYKWVRYKVDGKTYDVMAYCLQHALHSPPRGTTYHNAVEFDESGDDKYLRKAMFYGYGGPGWNGTFNNHSIKALFNKYGVGSNAREMQHYLADYLYDGSYGFGGYLSEKGKQLLRDCKAALKQMPDPIGMELLPSASITAKGRTTETLTWKANKAFDITIDLPGGVSLVNETTGKTGTDKVKVNGGDKFHLENNADDPKSKSGSYPITCTYPLDFHAMALKFQSYQDIIFGYRTNGKGISLNVTWPDSTKVYIRKVSSDPKVSEKNPNYNFEGVTFTMTGNGKTYTFVCDANGNSKEQEVKPGTYTIHEKKDTVPKGYKWSADKSWTVNTKDLHQKFDFADEPETPHVKITKKSSDPEAVKSNPNYSFSGATFTLTGYGKTYTFVCDADGNSPEQELPLGDYTLTETVTPTGFRPMNPATKTVTVVSGAEHQTFEVTDEPDTPWVSITKKSADPDAVASNPNYSFNGATFTLTGYGHTYTFVCDANGNTAEQTIPTGDYTLAETVTPTGYKPMSPAIKTVTVVRGQEHQAFEVADEPFTTPVKIQKKSLDETVTANNKMYSFANAAFTLTGYGKTYSFTCNADGTSNTVNVPLGTYTLHETSAPAGFKTAADQTVTVTAQTEQVFTVSDEPLVGTLNPLVDKVPHHEYATTRPTADAYLTVNYYDSAEPAGTPKNSWVIKTIKDMDGKYRAKLDQAHLAHGSLVYGENRVPLGCVTVQEAKPPEGYLINDMVWKLQILQSGNSVIYSSTTQPEIQNEPVDPEELGEIPTFGDLKLGKISAEQGTTPDGDATFKGAVFEIINANDFDVVLNTDHGKAIHPGEVATTITTGDDGTGQTTGNLIQTGKYTVREKTAPEGYTLSDKSLPVTIAAKQLADYSNKDPHKNIPQRAGFKVRKKDLELAEKICILTDKTGASFRVDQTTPKGNVIQGEAKLQGAEFDLINRSASSVVVDAKTYQPGDTIASFTTDVNGEFSSPASKDVNGNPLPPEQYLPYGTYELVETKAPEGFNLRGKNLDVTFTIRKEDENKIKDLDSISAEDDVIRFDLDIHKVEAKLNEEDDDDKMAPMKGIQFDIYLDADMNGDNPKEGVKPYVSIKTNSEGYATTIDENYPHGRLPYGHYTVIENKDSMPEGFKAIRNLHVNGTADGGVYDGQLIQTGIYQDQHGAWLQLAKIDEDSRKPVLRAGAEIQILKSDTKTVVELRDSTNHKKVSTFVTNEEGIVYLPQRLDIGTYYLKELKAPYGYVLNKDLVEFKVNTANSWDQLITWQMKDKEVKGILKITKTDAETKEKIAGAVFGVYADEEIISGDGTVQAEKGDQVDTVVIGKDGVGQSKELYLGKYHTAEIEAPEGYTLDPTEHPFTLEYKDQDTPIVYAEIEASNKPTTVKLTKYEWTADKNGEWTDDDPTKTLDGVTFDITRIGGADADRNRAGEVYAGGREVTKDDGTIVVKYVETGIYSITETATLPGYVLDSTPSWFTVDEDGYVFMSDEKGNSLDGQTKSDKAETMKKDQYTRWDFSKVDMNGEELKGAKMQVLDSEGNVATYQDDKWEEQKAEWTSDGTPHRKDSHSISGLEVGKTYTLTEVTAPEGYAVAESIEFTVPDDGQNQTLSMKDKRVTIGKLDVLGNPVAGAKLAVYELTEETTDDSAAETEQTEVPAQTEENQTTVPQTEADAGSEGTTTAPASGAEIATEEADKTQAADEIAETSETSAESETSQSEQNAETETGTETGNVTTGTAASRIGKLIDTWTTDGNPHAVSGLIVGHTYRLVEESAPAGYAVADAIDFTVTKEDTDQSIAMIDRQVLVSKVNTEITMIAGAKLEVRDKTGKIIDNWTSDGKPHAVSGLKVGETYTLVETEAPEGYVLAAPIEFTVSDKADANDELNLINKQVMVTKTDLTGEKEVEGAQLSVVEKDTGKTADTWTSDKEAHPVSGLEVGKTYILTETRPADGYVTAESIEFTVEDDFKSETHQMKDDVTKLKISKQDITNSKELPGAQLVIKDSEGNEIEKWTSSTEPHYIEMLPIGTYTLTEIAPPALFMKAEDVHFEVKDTGDIQTVTMFDKPTTVVLHKKDIVDGEKGEELPGAKLEVRDSTGKVIDSWTSGTTPYEIAYLAPGTYTLTEVTAPSGYDVAENVTFSVADNGQVQHVTMYDSPKEEKIDLTGKKKTTTTTTPTGGGGGSTPSYPTGGSSTPTAPVKTGDTTPILMYLGILGAAAAGIVLLLVWKKKKERDSEE